MRKLDPAVPHRLGRRTYFIPAPEGAVTPWAEVIDAASDAAERRRLATGSVATVLIADWNGVPSVQAADTATLQGVFPDELFAVRRPASHEGMRNYPSRVVVPSQRHEARAVWCESFNEQGHLRDILLTRRPLQVTSQPFRWVWSFAAGIRWHVPDFLLLTADGARLLVDVTTETKLHDPRVVAMFKLTQQTARECGWQYELRSELPPQRVRNINFLHACRQDVRQDRAHAVRRLRQHPGVFDVMRAAAVLGDGAQGYARLWDLIASGELHISLNCPIDLDSPVHLAEQTEEASWLHAL